MTYDSHNPTAHGETDFKTTLLPSWVSLFYNNRHKLLSAKKYLKTALLWMLSAKFLSNPSFCSYLGPVQQKKADLTSLVSHSSMWFLHAHCSPRLCFYKIRVLFILTTRLHYVVLSVVHSTEEIQKNMPSLQRISEFWDSPWSSNLEQLLDLWYLSIG